MGVVNIFMLYASILTQQTEHGRIEINLQDVKEAI